MNACGFLGIVVFAVSYWPCSVSCTAAELISYPESNLTLPLGQASPAVFHCVGRGTYLVWKINGTPVPEEDEMDYKPRGFAFRSEYHSNGTRTTTLTVSVMTATNNNTVLNCHATGNPGGPRTSPDVVLTIAGPPLTPHPTFQIVNATHIQLQWDKPYAFPGYDVRSYSLITSYDNSSETSKHIQVSQSQEYPLVHYISNGGHIPQECVHMNFTLTATNEAGTSKEGYATGGFPIAPPPIDNNLVYIRVTHSSSDFNPILQINFIFPAVCDYHDAFYSVLVYDVTEAMIVARTRVTTYDRDGPDSLEVVVDHGMQKDRFYMAFINVTTAVNSTIQRVPFNTCFKSSVSYNSICYTENSTTAALDDITTARSTTSDALITKFGLSVQATILMIIVTVMDEHVL